MLALIIYPIVPKKALPLTDAAHVKVAPLTMTCIIFSLNTVLKRT